MPSYRFVDLIDVQRLQRMVDDLYAIGAVPVAILDTEENILARAGWQDICTMYHRKNALSLARCLESGRYIKEHLQESDYTAYKCKNNLWDIGVPIITKGQHLATLFIGQFFYEDETPDYDFFRRQAHELGFEEEAYISALQRVPVFTHERVKAMLDYYINLVNFLSENALAQWELKQTLHSLHISEERLRLSLEATTDAVWDWHIPSGQAYFSPRYYSMLGYEPDEFPAGYESWCNLLHPDDRLEAERALEKHLHLSQSYAIEFRMRAKNGEWRWILGRGRIMETDADGNPLRMLGTHTDITESKAAAEKLRESEAQYRRLSAELETRVQQRTTELQAANKELEAFAYSIAHDLRTPLRSINGFSQLLKEDYYDDLDDQAKNYLCRIRAATERMGELIDNLLQLMRLTRAEMKHREVDLSKIARHVAAKLHANDPHRSVAWTITPDLITQGDQHLLRVVMENLLSNAWKFTATVPMAQIGFGVTQQDGQTVFFVRDNGVGFDMNYAGKLFGVFQRMHNLRDYEGTGMGLAIVQRIIQRHGGKIWAESTIGSGATFFFTL